MKTPGWIKIPLLILFFFEGITAMISGMLFLLKPSGAYMQMSVDWLDGSPFHNFLIPGLALFSILGVGSMATAILLLRRKPLAYWMGITVGMGTLIWIGVQYAVILRFSFLQVFYVAAGLTMVVLSTLALRQLHGQGERLL